MSLPKRIKKAIRGVPGVDPILKLLKLTDYEDWRYGRGVYPSYEEAAASIPASTKAGYDHSESAVMYAEIREQVRPSDYAMFYWLRPLLPEVRRLFDLGGNLGRSYFPSEISRPPRRPALDDLRCPGGGRRRSQSGARV
jgi:hypothetical protein